MSSEHVMVQTGQTVTTTTETVIGTITIPPLNESVGDGVLIAALVTGTAGTGATGIIVKIRQDSISGSAINIGQGNAIPVTAGSPFSISAAALDTALNYPTGRTYVVTIQQVAATGNATTVSSVVNSTPATSLVG